jgi:hypothetical protein
MNRELDKIFGPLTPSSNSSVQVLDVQSQMVTKADEDQVKDDFDFARDNVRHTINIARDMTDKLIVLANESEKAAFFDVLNKALNTISMNSRVLLDLHDQKNSALGMKKGEITNSRITQNNVVFSGTPKDLKKLIENDEE